MKEKEEFIIRESLSDIATMDFDNAKKQKVSKRNIIKFIVYFLIIIGLTAFALVMSLKDNFSGVINAFSSSKPLYFLIIIGIILLIIAIDGFIIFLFSRLFTRDFNYKQGVATSLIGTFYSNVMSKTTGQVMEAMSLKKQGITLSSAASIMVMGYIVKQICTLISNICALIFSDGLLSNIGTFDFVFKKLELHIPSVILVIIGFTVTTLSILTLFGMSYSRKLHGLIINQGVGVLGKLKIIKNPNKTRENLRILVENFKIELRRLTSNVPIFILMIICFSISLIVRYSIPFFAGLGLNGYGVESIGQFSFKSFWHAVFLSSYQQMAVGLIPIPGGAGVSEYIFSTVFRGFYLSEEISIASQIIWRFSTYHIILIISGIVAATYKGAANEEINAVDRKTYINLQYVTISERQASADKSRQTAYFSRQEFLSSLRQIGKPKSRTKGKTHERQES